MKKISVVLALMVATLFGGLLIESAAAQNMNSSSMSNMSNNMGRHRHRHRRRHRRHRRRMPKNSNM